MSNGTYLVIAALFGVGVTLLGIWKFIPRAKAEQASKLWKDESEAQTARGDRLEKQVAELNAQVHTMQARIEAQDQTIKTMQELITGKGRIDELTKVVQDQHQQVLAAISGLK